MTDRPKQRAPSEERTRELAARKRVAALVSGGLHFKIKREDGRVEGHRGASPAKLIVRLTSKTFSPEVTLDLREKPTANFREAISSFVSLHHRRGVQQLSILFDPPSAEGAEADSPLETILAALTLGQAAALVRAFATPREGIGAKSALAVLLI